jgi:hypothetical protein
LSISIERAHEINSAMMAHVWFREGLRTDEPPSLGGYSLREMLDAVDRVKELNAAAESQEGRKTVHMTCDPRLVAALYVAYHYPGEDPGNCLAVALGNGCAVLVVGTRFLSSE